MTNHLTHYTKGLACLLLSLAIACSLEAQTAKSGKKKNPFSKGALPLPEKPAPPKPKTPTPPPYSWQEYIKRLKAKTQANKPRTAKTQQAPSAKRQGASKRRTQPQESIYKYNWLNDFEQVTASTALANGNNARDLRHDYPAARRWYRIAADQGNAEAQNSLADLYDQGLGGAVNKQEAFYWYNRAAQNGYTAAQFNLGMCYYSGEGTTINYGLAVQWFSRAAGNGDADAQYMLGLCYYEGKGIAKNMVYARYWLERAARGGSAPAKDLFYEINAKDQSSASTSSRSYASSSYSSPSTSSYSSSSSSYSSSRQQASSPQPKSRATSTAHSQAQGTKSQLALRVEAGVNWYDFKTEKEYGSDKYIQQTYSYASPRAGLTLEIPITRRIYLAPGISYSQSKIEYKVPVYDNYRAWGSSYSPPQIFYVSPDFFSRPLSPTLTLHHLNPAFGMGYRWGNPKKVAFSLELALTCNLLLRPLKDYFKDYQVTGVNELAVNTSAALELYGIVFRAGADWSSSYSNRYLTLGYRF